MPKLEVHAITKGSMVNGPGPRTVIHLSGCSIKCPGCFNPDTWSNTRKFTRMGTRALAEALMIEVHRGVTISGGEPLDQYEALSHLLSILKSDKRSGDIIMFTGYRMTEIRQDWINHLKDTVDVLITGPYMAKRPILRTQPRMLRGSRNQKTSFFTKTVSKAELENLDDHEVIIEMSGDMTILGFPTHGDMRILV